MSGKGDIQRPTQVDAKTFSDNWNRVFGNKFRGARSEHGVILNHGLEGAIPSTPAIYIDDATGQEVSESWWPGDPLT